MRRRSWGILSSLPLLPSLPRFLCIPVRERPICLVLPPGGPIPASLRPPRLPKTCVVSPQWTTCQRLRGNNSEEGSRTPKGKYFSLPSPTFVDQLADVSRCYGTWADIITDSSVLDIVKYGITLDFCYQAFCSNYTPRCSLTAEGAKAVDCLSMLSPLPN